MQQLNLEVGAMHGPITTMVDIYVMLPNQRIAKLHTRMAVGVIPTRAELKAVLEAAIAPESIEASSIPAGTRLLTKAEFVEHILKKEGGKPVPLPGDQAFEAVPGDVPHGMLVNAIKGVDLSDELEKEYIDRGLAKIYYGAHGDEAFTWVHEKLDAMPDDVLSAIYQRIAGE